VSSISDCLADGSARITPKDQAHFASMAYASAIETINHLIGAHDLEYISDDDYFSFRTKVEELTNKINALRRAILNRA
jgi:four helix bundle protein